MVCRCLSLCCSLQSWPTEGGALTFNSLSESVLLPPELTYRGRGAYFNSLSESVLLPPELTYRGRGAYFNSLSESVLLPLELTYRGRGAYLQLAVRVCAAPSRADLQREGRLPSTRCQSLCCSLQSWPTEGGALTSTRCPSLCCSLQSWPTEGGALTFNSLSESVLLPPEMTYRGRGAYLQLSVRVCAVPSRADLQREGRLPSTRCPSLCCSLQSWPTEGGALTFNSLSESVLLPPELTYRGRGAYLQLAVGVCAAPSRADLQREGRLPSTRCLSLYCSLQSCSQRLRRPPLALESIQNCLCLDYSGYVWNQETV